MYHLVCEPENVHAAANCRIISQGRIQIIFLANSGEHEDTSAALHKEIGQAVLPELTASPTWIKFRRVSDELKNAKAQLDAMDIESQTETLTKKRDWVIAEMPHGTAQQLQDIDREIAQLSDKAESVRGQITMLTPMVDSLRGQVESLAASLSAKAMNATFATLSAREVKASALLSSKAGALVGALAEIKSSQQMASRYGNSEFGRVWVDAALAK